MMRSYVVLLLWPLALALMLLGCMDESPAPISLPSQCQQLAKALAVDESCAIEIAKKEIVARQGKLDYTKFKTRFDQADNLWVVAAIHEPEIPGGFVVVSIAKDGKVVDFSLGL